MRRWLLLAGMSVGALPAWAACSTISSTNLSFGIYTGSAISSTATVTVNCTVGFVYLIGVGGGDSGNSAARVMDTSPAVTHMSYQMYRDVAHLLPWGYNSAVDTVAGVGTGTNQTFTIYGVLPAGQNLVSGNYADYPIVYVQSGPFVTFNPLATVPSSCTISAGNLSFGMYASTTTYATSILSVNCTQNTSWDIGLSAGTSTGATVTNRAMTGPSSSTLAYGLFQTNAYTQNWGMTSGTDTVTGLGTGIVQSVTVYGRIPGGLYSRPGSYSDTITVTVSY